ncbi:MAG: hypothetical protein KA764_12420 [Anaerolineales bacterium]|nr:hypothetical protein [Anaerolineales bacterium]
MDTPNTLNYMLLGYAVLFGLPLLYVISWWFRRRNLRRDLELLKSLADEKKP